VSHGAGCTFPDYRVTRGEDSTGGSSGTGAGGSLAAAATGGMSAGAAAGFAGHSSTAGDAGTAGVNGAAGADGSDDTGSWSAPELEQLGFSLLGSAKLQFDGVDLTRDRVGTQAGGIAQREPVELGVDPALHVTVGFRIQGGELSGDGMAIVLHASPDGYLKLGGSGGSIGYDGISPCIAIEVDIEKQVEVDLPTPHLAVMSGCHHEKHGVSSSDLGGDPTDGADWILSVDWNRVNHMLEVRLRRLDTSDEPTVLSAPIDLVQLLGARAFVLVSAATGDLSATHSVRTLHVKGGGLGARTLENPAF